MAKQNIAPTKSNYHKIQVSLARAEDGHRLLEQKRQILVMRLMDYVEDAKALKGEIEETMSLAYAGLQRAALESGMERLERRSLGLERDYSLEITMESVVGVYVPHARFRSSPLSVQFSLSEGGSASDEVLLRFRSALKLIARLAEVENAVCRLAREVGRTRRRVNALEKTFIPDYKDTLKYISGTLEEHERESQVVMRKVKTRREGDRRRTMSQREHWKQP